MLGRFYYCIKTLFKVLLQLMKKKKNNFYVVWNGHTPGIYTSWDKCKKQVDGYEAAKYKGFGTEQEAIKAFQSNPMEYYGKTAAPKVDEHLLKRVGKPLKNALCVDAACSGNPGIMEYRGVELASGKEVFKRGPFPMGTTNIGEFLAIVTGLAILKLNNSPLPLYSDSRNGIKWTKQKHINTTLQRTQQTETLFETIDKALEWLHSNSYETQILKWETEAWGEIPADFGRK